eukprot:snap_masked-scaffold_8-processed-gene-13.29-mRNA-1 protein AED:0.24 eAED:0.29 QI:0/0/0/0.66/1/1/3/0/380
MIRINLVQRLVSIVSNNKTKLIENGQGKICSKKVPQSLVKLTDKIENIQDSLKLLDELDSNQREEDIEWIQSERDQLNALQTNELKIFWQNSIPSFLDAYLPETLRTDFSKHTAFVEINPRTGGEEAALFANEIYSLIEKFSTAKNWNHETISYQPFYGSHTKPGLRNALLKVELSNKYEIKYPVFATLQELHGNHRVKRIPVTETKGRLHTSVVNVSVTPFLNNVKEEELSLEEVQFQTFKSGGKGGQHANTTDSAVRATHLPSGLNVVIETSRSQHKNKELALKVLTAKVNSFRKKESENEIESAKELVNSVDEVLRDGKPIRTYHFGQNYIADHRLREQIMGTQALENIFDGKSVFAKSYLDYRSEQFLENLLQQYE